MSGRPPEGLLWDAGNLQHIGGHGVSRREVDEAYWGQPMTCRDVAEHARLIDESNFGFPIILSSDGRIMDGMHRVLKALIQGRSQIEAVRFEIDPEPDYVGLLDPADLPCEEEPNGNDGWLSSRGDR